MELRSLPRSKKAGMHIEQIGDELLVYNLADHRVHRLNASLAVIWQNADGSRTRDQLAEQVRQRLHIPCDAQIVALALRQLQSSDLLESCDLDADPLPTRRELGLKLANWGLAASALPLLASIVSPTPAMARSQASWTPQQVRADLKTAAKDAKGKTLTNQEATDFADATANYAAGNDLYHDGPKYRQAAQQDLQNAETDLSAFFTALGL